MPLNLEQRKRLRSWEYQRDHILKDLEEVQNKLQTARAEYDLTKKSNIDAGQAFSALEKQIAETKGRLSELQALEDRTKNSVSNDVVKLIEQKSKLDIEIQNKNSELFDIESKKESLLKDIDGLVLLHDKVFDKTKITEEILGKMVSVSQTNISDINAFVDKLKRVVEKVIEKANKNVAQTDIVLGKLPKYIFEMAKPLPVRRIPKDERRIISGNNIVKE